MRNTLVQRLAECVQRRLKGQESPSKLLEMITTQGKNRLSCILPSGE